MHGNKIGLIIGIKLGAPLCGLPMVLSLVSANAATWRFESGRKTIGNINSFNRIKNFVTIKSSDDLNNIDTIDCFENCDTFDDIYLSEMEFSR